MFALLIVGAVGYAATGPAASLYLVASMGAAVVLLQAVPHSPLSQPWPLLGGHVISALIGVTINYWLPDTFVAGPLAVALAVVAMYFLHCLHPPGGAAALVAVIGGDAVHQLGYWYVLMPVGLNALVLLMVSLLVNNIVPSRSYPAKIAVQLSEEDPFLKQVGLDEDDLIAALHARDMFLDISRADLREIYRQAIMHANKRRIGEVICRDIMTQEVMSFEFHESCATAWKALQDKKIKAAPVVDKQHKIVGIVAVSDFLRTGNHRQTDSGDPGTEAPIGMPAQAVGNIMSTPAISVVETLHIVDLLPVFIDHSIHHIPVTDAKSYLRGMITRTDLMRALLVTYI